MSITDINYIDFFVCWNYAHYVIVLVHFYFFVCPLDLFLKISSYVKLLNSYELKAHFCGIISQNLY